MHNSLFQLLQLGLANILENIVEILKEKIEILYLFLKPVLRKEPLTTIELWRDRWIFLQLKRKWETWNTRAARILGMICGKSRIILTFIMISVTLVFHHLQISFWSFVTTYWLKMMQAWPMLKPALKVVSIMNS